MNEEVERHRVIRDSLELELQVLRQMLSSVENFTENADSGNSITQQPEDHISMSVLLLSSLNEIFSFRFTDIQRNCSDAGTCKVDYWNFMRHRIE